MPPEQPQQSKNKIQTKVITNFGGRLTRYVNGDLDSGMAKFATSYGYDPFSKPGNITWLNPPVNYAASASVLGVSDLAVAAKTRVEALSQYVYAIGSSGNLYKLTPYFSPGSPPNPSYINSSLISALGTTYGNFTAGASMEFFGAPQQIYLGSNQGVARVNFDGSSPSIVGGTTNWYNTSGVGRPLKKFAGLLAAANGNTFAVIDGNSKQVTSSIIGTGNGNLYSQLNPPLPTEDIVKDLDVSKDGNYLQMAASDVLANGSQTVVAEDSMDGAQGTSTVFYWNGSDATVTAQNRLASGALSALHTYLGSEIFFSTDTFGAMVGDDVTKLLTLPGNKAPAPNATAVNGNFLTWVCPEVSPDGTDINASLYYFGSLDQENPPGLYRLFRYGGTLSSSFVYQTPMNVVVSGNSTVIYQNQSGVAPQAYGQHYLSMVELKNGGSQFDFLVFYTTPIASLGISPNFGVYETQTQLFSKKVAIKQIRVYTEPTVASNSFQVDCIGSDGAVITNNNANTYTYAAGTDPTLLQGSLERIDFSPAMRDTYALGIRLSNLGTVNMVIHKVEVDFTESGQ